MVISGTDWSCGEGNRWSSSIVAVTVVVCVQRGGYCWAPVAESKKGAEVGGGGGYVGYKKSKGLGNGQGQNEAQLPECMCVCGSQSV